MEEENIIPRNSFTPPISCVIFKKDDVGIIYEVEERDMETGNGEILYRSPEQEQYLQSIESLNQ